MKMKAAGIIALMCAGLMLPPTTASAQTLAAIGSQPPRTPVPLPERTPASSSSRELFLAGVSCTSRTFCEAVGAASNPALAEVWNGTTWTKQTVPNPPHSVGGPALYDVACVTSKDCEAVGYYQDSSYGQEPVAEVWDGTAWKVQATPKVSGADSGGSSFSGVSCASASACEAVGYYTTNSAGPFTLAEVWNGSTWARQTTPKPGYLKGSGDQFFNVSCASATACEAVGYYDTSSTQTAALAVRWNGSTWAQQSVSIPMSKDTQLQGVFCRTANSCEAAGYTASSGVVDLWNGATWTPQTVDDPGAVSFEAVTCASPTACEAVGVGSVIAERWNGTGWTKQSAPNPNGLGNLTGVSCPAANVCEAVGYIVNRGSGGFFAGPLAEAWNGTTWKRQAVP
jgi:hypothetical protein